MHWNPTALIFIAEEKKIVRRHIRKNWGINYGGFQIISDIEFQIWQKKDQRTLIRSFVLVQIFIWLHKIASNLSLKDKSWHGSNTKQPFSCLTISQCWRPLSDFAYKKTPQRRINWQWNRLSKLLSEQRNSGTQQRTDYK